MTKILKSNTKIHFFLWRFRFWLYFSCYILFISSTICRYDTVILFVTPVAATQEVVATTPDEYLTLGDESLSMDHIEEAITYYEKGIQLVAEQRTTSTTSKDATTTISEPMIIMSLSTNLATSYSSIGNHEKAIEHYENSLKVYKNQMNSVNKQDDDTSNNEESTSLSAQTAFYLGMVYEDVDRYRDAIDAYSYSTSLDPYHWAAYANVGALLYDRFKNYPAALKAYNKAYNLLTNPEAIPTDPPPEPRPILAQLQYRIGLCLSSHQDASQQKCVIDDDKIVDCMTSAAHAFSLAIEFDPLNSESAKHMLATITADATMERASNEYVKALFDDYAHHFEQSLVQELHYTGYERLRRGFDKAFRQYHQHSSVPLHFPLVVDAGCGTGLVGEQFRNVSGKLIGVDLSETILQQAIQSRPNLYDEVVATDVIDFFRQRKPIDLIIAGDSFIYFGDLEPLFHAIADGLKDDEGFVAFTLENVNQEDATILLESKADWRWKLTASGRFVHRKEYVIEVGQRHHLQLFYYEPLIDFRYEHGKGVQGHIFIMKKSKSPTTINDEL